MRNRIFPLASLSVAAIALSSCTMTPAETARAAALDAIRYQSVRDPQARANVALLTCRVFRRHDAVERQTWHLHVGRAGVRAVCEAPARSLAFGLDVFAADPRLTPLRRDG